MGALASGRPHRRPACGAKHHGGGGLGPPPADAIEASALRARPRWRGRSAPGACGEAPSLESGWGASVHARNLRDCRPDQAASSGQIFGRLSKAENLQPAFAGGGKGLARAAARADEPNALLAAAGIVAFLFLAATVFTVEEDNATPPPPEPPVSGTSQPHSPGSDLLASSGLSAFAS